MYRCMYVRIYVFVYVCVYAYKCVCMFICICICMYVCIRVCADKSLARPTSRCRRTESIMSLERGVCSCAELQVFSCYRD